MVRNALIALAITLALSQPVAAATSGDGERLLGPNGAPLFILGMNYEGPADRAWQMWENDKFDPAAIEADFDRAASKAGVNTIRLFVQPALAVDIAASKFDKLDQVVAIAEKHNLQLILSLHDYTERDLARVAATAGQLAQRYRGRPGVLAFDLKNEPRFSDLSLSKYASPVPLQQRRLIEALGDRLPRDQLADFRASEEGSKSIPSYLSDDEAFIYVNNLRLYREMLADASAWVKQSGGTTLDYLDDAAGKKWAPLVSALNGSLQAWLAPQVQAIRNADPLRAITVDHVDGVLARLSANNVLDFQSLHRYPGAGAASIRANLSLLKTMQRAHPGKPLVLSEFGYATESIDPAKSAIDEAAIMLGLLSQRSAGGIKWMLNDMPQGFNMRERTLGAFRLDGSSKPVVDALAGLRAYLDSSGSSVGELRLDDDPESGIRYVYKTADALLLGGKKVDGGAVSFDAPVPAQLFVTWSEPGSLRLWATADMKATVDVAQIPGGSGAAITLTLQPGKRVLQLSDANSSRGADYDVAGGHFFTQTNGRKDSRSGFGVSDEAGIPFWTSFKALGGVDVLGYPVTRRFEMDGFIAQAFQKSVLQWRPEQKTFAFLNTFDVLHDRGLDAWLQVYRQTPPPLDMSPDSGQPWARVMARHLALLDKVPPALTDRFLADSDWLDHYGLPVSSQDLPNSVVVRAQRASLQYWKEAVPWAAKGTVTVANGGDLAKEAGVFPWLAVTPENAPR